MYVSLFYAKTDTVVVNLKPIKSSINNAVTYKRSKLLLYFN